MVPENVLMRAGCEHIFLSSIEFVSWWQQDCASKNEVNSVYDLKVLRVMQRPSFYRVQHGTLLQDPQLKRQRHANIVERSNHIWRKILPFSSMLVRSCDKASGYIVSTKPGLTN